MPITNKYSIPLSKKEGGIIAGLWRNILNQNNYINSINVLVDKYVAKTNKLSQRIENVRRKTKSSLIKSIFESDMTFKTFIDLLFNFINVKRLTITVKLTFPNGMETIHTVVTVNPNIQNEEKNEEKNTPSD